jgi:hypothetical protein
VLSKSIAVVKTHGLISTGVGFMSYSGDNRHPLCLLHQAF